MKRALLIAAATAILVATGIAHGLRTDRWGGDKEVAEAVRRLKDVPEQVGDWSSKEAEIDERQLKIAQIAGHVFRQYTHVPTGRSVNVLIVVGRPGAIGAHSPDVCYQASGFRLTSEEKTRPVRLSGEALEFSRAVASKSEPRPEQLVLWWAWSTDGVAWECPTSPRGYYWRSPVLYKIYFVRSVGDPRSGDDLTPSLMEELLPKVKQALTPR